MALRQTPRLAGWGIGKRRRIRIKVGKAGSVDAADSVTGLAGELAVEFIFRVRRLENNTLGAQRQRRKAG